MRFLFACAMVCLLPAAVRADRAQDLARIHLEAIGGAERIAELKSLRATGQVVSGDKRVRFTMTAARPNRIRVETEAGGRTLVQGSDGEEPAWEFDTGTWPPQYRAMAPATAKTFVADAEFDDPLVAGAERGYTFDFAGEMKVDGQTFLRVLVTKKLASTFSVVIDPRTYFIVMRIEHRESAGGQKAQVVTHYGDFRPVDGVLLPHQVAVAVNGKVTQRTSIERIDANPELAEDTFRRPRAAAKPAKR